MVVRNHLLGSLYLMLKLCKLVYVGINVNVTLSL